MLTVDTVSVLVCRLQVLEDDGVEPSEEWCCLACSSDRAGHECSPTPRQPQYILAHPNDEI